MGECFLLCYNMGADAWLQLGSLRNMYLHRNHWHFPSPKENHSNPAQTISYHPHTKSLVMC